MKERTFSVVSNYDGLQLQGVIYEPDAQPKGIVQLVHGMCVFWRKMGTLRRVTTNVVTGKA